MRAGWNHLFSNEIYSVFNNAIISSIIIIIVIIIDVIGFF